MDEIKTLPKQAITLGVLGLLPFLALPLFKWLLLFPKWDVDFGFIAYSAIILSFFGGVHWHASLTTPAHQQQINIAMLPSIIAWLAILVLSQALTLWILLLSYILILGYDSLTLEMPKGYRRLRIALTTLVVLAHLWMLSLLAS